MTLINKPMSAALEFLAATERAIPKTLGDRDRVKAMSEATDLAVRNRFSFDKDDGPKLARLGIRTCVGIYSALDYYREACQSGGTYARMWESYCTRKPWLASRAIAVDYRHNGSCWVLENNRVAERMGVLLPAGFGEDSSDYPSYKGFQVWWCTSQDNHTIILCRYRVSERYPSPFTREGSPARIRKLSREEWLKWNPKVEKEVPAAA